jgi:hypothetical protein
MYVPKNIIETLIYKYRMPVEDGRKLQQAFKEIKYIFIII